MKVRKVIEAANHAFMWYFANIPALCTGIVVLVSVHMAYGLLSGMPVENIRETVHGIWWSAIGTAAGATLLMIATESLLKAIDKEQREGERQAKT